ncbi:unnamed protein product [Dovyalis caffra]|uniref:Uncharacterized protein n=1 Tax=Dovyalis caffra TaxID=77055 RepID=A0AAV1R4P4_9ROSI|nr:unnamed protein product [Dovyalis caffra]
MHQIRLSLEPPTRHREIQLLPMLEVSMLISLKLGQTLTKASSLLEMDDPIFSTLQDVNYTHPSQSPQPQESRSSKECVRPLLVYTRRKANSRKNKSPRTKASGPDE